MPAPSQRYFQRFSNIGGTAVAGNLQVALQVDTARRAVIIQSVRVLRASGASGTNVQPRLYDATGASAGAVSERWRASSATAPGTLVNTYNINAVAFTSATGVLFFIVDGDAADTFEYEVVLESAQP